MTVARNASWTRRDNAVIWHPFTPMRTWLDDDRTAGRIITDAEGFELIDEHGDRYIDGFSSLWCNLHGHRVPAIDEAIRAQLERAAHTTLLGHGSPPAIALAERLVAVTPADLKKVFYSDSGATAMEIALKMAYQFHANRGEKGRDGFIALGEAYHGDTIGSVSLGGIGTFHRMFGPLLFETTFVPTPNPYHNPDSGQGGGAVLDEIDRLLGEHPQRYCAVAVEPLVQGAAGMLTHPAGFLAGVRELTRKHGVLMIVDEVATGFCSTGRLFACEHEAVCPDIMALGKKLTGGYLPVAATVVTDEVFDAFCGESDEGKTFYHGHTFTGNALGCAAGIASIDLIEADRLPDRLPEKVDMIRSSLDSLADHPYVGDIRQCGMMAGIELVADRETGAPFDPAARIGAAVCFSAREKGIIIRPLGDVVILMPAPAMDTGTLRRLLDGILEALREYPFE